jgi:hypothetical protein
MAAKSWFEPQIEMYLAHSEQDNLGITPLEKHA